MTGTTYESRTRIDCIIFNELVQAEGLSANRNSCFLFITNQINSAELSLCICSSDTLSAPQFRAPLLSGQSNLQVLLLDRSGRR